MACVILMRSHGEQFIVAKYVGIEFEDEHKMFNVYQSPFTRQRQVSFDHRVRPCEALYD